MYIDIWVVSDFGPLHLYGVSVLFLVHVLRPWNPGEEVFFVERERKETRKDRRETPRAREKEREREREREQKNKKMKYTTNK